VNVVQRRYEEFVRVLLRVASQLCGFAPSAEQEGDRPVRIGVVGEDLPENQLAKIDG
jgi:hypothetical protein